MAAQVADQMHAVKYTKCHNCTAINAQINLFHLQKVVWCSTSDMRLTSPRCGIKLQANKLAINNMSTCSILTMCTSCARQFP